mmetsp:Transcript_8357/g.26122  ORF Transcript_8357/g.26122 Transcript_8357/m.26122 type:complete len:212 (-) Transcript_8357:146-781(-)
MTRSSACCWRTTRTSWRTSPCPILSSSSALLPSAPLSSHTSIRRPSPKTGTCCCFAASGTSSGRGSCSCCSRLSSSSPSCCCGTRRSRITAPTASTSPPTSRATKTSSPSASLPCPRARSGSSRRLSSSRSSPRTARRSLATTTPRCTGRWPSSLTSAASSTRRSAWTWRAPSSGSTTARAIGLPAAAGRARRCSESAEQLLPSRWRIADS